MLKTEVEEGKAKEQWRRPEDKGSHNVEQDTQKEVVSQKEAPKRRLG